LIFFDFFSDSNIPLSGLLQWIHKMNQIKKKLRRIEKIKEEICTITEMRIGSLIEQLIFLRICILFISLISQEEKMLSKFCTNEAQCYIVLINNFEL
jgi:hypothetical protein